MDYLFKTAMRGDSSYSVTLFQDNRLSIHRSTGKACGESVDLPGTIEDFNSFSELQPELWFATAALILTIRERNRV